MKRAANSIGQTLKRSDRRPGARRSAFVVLKSDVNPELSVVVPFFNEAKALPHFCSQLRQELESIGLSYEVILVDDGSEDGSSEWLKALNWPECTLLRFARNSGHQEALDAGLRVSTGQLTVTMDADLQHPPRAIRSLIEAAQSTGVDVVYATPSHRNSDSWYKRNTARLYYWLMKHLAGVNLTPSAADFRLVSRKVVDIVNQLPEEKVFRLLLPALGFASTTVNYTATPRIAGVSKYSFVRMLRLGTRSVLLFSLRPLQIATFLGWLAALASLAWLVWVLVSVAVGNTVEGWASLTSLILFLGGVQLISMGIFGSYLGQTFEAVRSRPRHVVVETFRLTANGRDSMGG